MSTRQVAGLIAAAAPEAVRPHDTLRAVAAGRYTLKVNIDEECERGLRRLKDLLSHRDPCMSWGDLVTHLVREAVARHDPRGSGRAQRRQRRTAANRRGAGRRRSVQPGARQRRRPETPRLRRRRSSAAARVMAPTPPPQHRVSPPLLRRRSRFPTPGRAAASRVPLPGRYRPQSPILPGVHAGRLHGALFLPLFGAWCGNATRDVVATAIRYPAVAVPLLICCRSTTCCPSPRAAATIRTIYASRASLITGCATAVGRLRNSATRRCAH